MNTKNRLASLKVQQEAQKELASCKNKWDKESAPLDTYKISESALTKLTKMIETKLSTKELLQLSRELDKQ